MRPPRSRRPHSLIASVLPTTRPLLLALAVLALSFGHPATSAAAQDAPVVTPGSDLLDLSRIEAGRTTYTVTVVQGDVRQELGTFTQTITVDEAAGVVENVSEMSAMGQKLADTTRAAWPTLAARYHYSRNPQRELYFAVVDGRLSGTHTPAGGAPEAFEVSVDGPFFDASWLDDVAAALPLAEGYAVSVPAYTYEAGGLADYTLRVIGSEKLTRQGKAAVDVWVVEAEQAGEDTVPRFYLTKEGHALVRIRIEPQPGVALLIDAQ